jgi:hypothetical protein
MPYQNTYHPTHPPTLIALHVHRYWCNRPTHETASFFGLRSSVSCHALPQHLCSPPPPSLSQMCTGTGATDPPLRPPASQQPSTQQPMPSTSQTQASMWFTTLSCHPQGTAQRRPAVRAAGVVAGAGMLLPEVVRQHTQTVQQQV